MNSHAPLKVLWSHLDLGCWLGWVLVRLLVGLGVGWVELVGLCWVGSFVWKMIYLGAGAFLGKFLRLELGELKTMCDMVNGGVSPVKDCEELRIR